MKNKQGVAQGVAIVIFLLLVYLVFLIIGGCKKRLANKAETRAYMKTSFQSYSDGMRSGTNLIKINGNVYYLPDEILADTVHQILMTNLTNTTVITRAPFVRSYPIMIPERDTRVLESILVTNGYFVVIIR